MTVSTDYLEMIKERHGLKNQNQLANFFNMSRQRINKYYTQNTRFDLEMCVHVADALEISTDEILIKLSHELNKSGKNREFWEKKLKDITPCILYSFYGIMSVFASVEHYILCKIGNIQTKRIINQY